MKRPVMMLLVVLLISTFAVAACGSKDEPTPEAGATAVATSAAKAVVAAKATEAPQAAKAQAAEPTVAPEPTVAEEADLNLSDRESGLDKLDSYKASWSTSWESTEKDQSTGKETTSTGKWAWTEEFVRDPRSSHVVWSTESSDQSSGGMEITEVGDMSYVLMSDADGNVSCIASTREDANSTTAGSMFNPTSLGSISGAKYVGRESVNGIPAKHYRYDQNAAGLLGLGTVKGDVWVSTDGEYVVKETTSWEGGTGGIFGLATPGSTGKGEWTWEVTEINQPIDIKQPEACVTASSALPILPDAKDKIQAGDAVMYSSATALDKVIEFYRNEMGAAGWQEQEGGMETPDMAMLSFAKDDMTAQLIASNQDGQTGISITVTK